MKRFVLDASVTLCWFFEDQATAYTDGVLDRLASGDEALTSRIWPLEVANALVVAGTAQANQTVAKRYLSGGASPASGPGRAH